MFYPRTLCMLLAAALLPHSATGHHGVSGQFDTRQTLEYTGTITRMRLVNPHAYLYFDLADENGDVTNMRCELHSRSTLRRRGWSEDLFEVGSQVTIIGSPDRDDPTTCHIEEITFADGLTATRHSVFADDGTLEVSEQSYVQSDGVPNFAGNWAMEQRERRKGRPPQVALTPEGAAKVEGATPEQNPRFNCQATNIALDWWFNQTVNMITQTETEIVLKYGFMDLVRTIYLDGRDMPQDFQPSRAGFSTGVWDGDTLVVTTTGFDEGWIIAPLGRRRAARSDGPRPERNREERPDRGDRAPRPEGRRRGPQPVMNSAALTVIERFSLDESGTTLRRSYSFDDPLYLEAPFVGSDEVSLTTDTYEPYQCDDLTDERKS